MAGEWLDAPSQAIGLPGPFDERSRLVGIGTWANRPAPSDVPPRSIYIVTDLNNTEMVTDGTYWRAVNGYMSWLSQPGLVGTPIATTTIALVSKKFTLPSGDIILPAGLMQVPGARLVVHSGYNRSVLGGTPTAIGVGATLGPNNVAATDPAIVATNIGASLGAVTRVDAFLTSMGFGTTHLTTAFVPPGSASGINGYSDRLFDFSAPNFLNFTIAGNGADTSTLGLLHYHVAIIF